MTLLFRAATAFILLSALWGCSDEKHGRCSPFSPCGGDLDGTWAIRNSCVEGNLTALANLNPKLPITCQDMYVKVSGAMTGTVAFQSGSAAIDTTMTIDYQINVSPECLDGFLPDAKPDAATCNNLGPALVLERLHGSVACEVAASGCSCSARDDFVNQESRTYSVSEAKIHYSGSTDYLEYCRSGNSMQGRQFDSMLVSTVFIDAELQP